MNETDSLKALIAKARRERGTSVRQLAIQAKAANFKIVGTTLNAIENGTYKSEPSDETLRAIAWLAGVADRVAFTAAGRRLPGPPFSEELPPGVDDLSPKEREAVIGLLRVLIAQRQEISRYDEEQKPRTQTGSTKHSGTSRSTRRPGTPIAADPSDKDDALIEEGQGSRTDFALAARKGETEYEIRKRTEPQPEDENQDPGTDDGA